MTQLPHLLTAAQLAAHLSMSERTVRHLAQHRRIPSVRLGKSYRFDPDAVAAHLRRLETSVTVPLPVERRERRRRARGAVHGPNSIFTEEELAGTAPGSLHFAPDTQGPRGTARGA